MEQKCKKKYVEKRPPDKKLKYVQKNQSTNIKAKKQEKIQLPKFIEKVSSHADQICCLICSETIKRKQPIWTCQCCFHYLHLRCMKEWILKFNIDLNDRQKYIYNWSCPQCKFQYNQSLPEYYCFCGKFKNPEYQRDLEPHSCGKVCQRKRGPFCIHLCPSLCHSGKCPPCEHEGTQVTCNCGKTQRIVKCSEERQVFQCGKKCEKILNCHKHKCQRNCHNAQCLPCKKKHLASCFCGKNEDVVDCTEVSYACEQICGKPLECGYHQCEQKCHEGQCMPCKKMPQMQKTCPCGRNSIQLLTGDPDFRKSCKDPIPLCGMPCKKILECGHQCPRSCHENRCLDCKIMVDQYCDCRITQRKIECYKANNGKYQFKCDNICKKKKSCGLHNCNTTCCKNKNSIIPQDHQCQLTCQKILNCKKHNCGEPCHMGLCKKCPVIYSQPQYCPCGSTSIKPPIICGSFIPQCQNICNKQLPCGHRCQMKCHYGICKCYQTVKVRCRCGLEDIQTTCGKETLCLNKCQKVLQCGHKCGLQCHSGTCIQAHKALPCRKICEKKRQNCDHFCSQPCHFGKKCQDFHCEAQILIKCECGNRQTIILCDNTDKKHKKAILCNKKCQNMKRFDALYKDKQIYYPNGIFQFGFKNFNYMQNLQQRLEKFISQSEQSFLEIQFKFMNDNNARVQLHNLFENHYHLNTHFYRYRKHASFTVLQTDDTMIPKPPLTQYIKQVAKGYIKRKNLPFQYTIKFQQMDKNKTDLILSGLKDFKHRYYIQKKDQHIYAHFWELNDGTNALDKLHQKFSGYQFIGQENIIQQQETDNIQNSEIVQKDIEISPNNEEKSQKTHTQQQKSNKIQQKSKQQQPNKQQELIKSQQQSNKQIKQRQKIQEPSTVQKPQVKQTQTKLVFRNKPITFQTNSYPPAKEFIQDIYQIDQDQIYHQQINWQEIVNVLCSKNLGPQASEWRIRALIMINIFHKVPETILVEQFKKILIMYQKEKQRASRILQIQNLNSKRVKPEMDQNGIYLSHHEPQIMSYIILFNYWSTIKLELQLNQAYLMTRQVEKIYQTIQSVENSNFEAFSINFKIANYLQSCAMVDLVHQIRENFINIIQKESVPYLNLYKYLLFSEEEKLLKYCQDNGILIGKRTSKKKGCQVYYLKQGKPKEQLSKDKQFLEIIKQKRDKKYILSQSNQLIDGRYLTRSFFAFGDFKETIDPTYMNNLVKQLKKQKQ